MNRQPHQNPYLPSDNHSFSSSQQGCWLPPPRRKISGSAQGKGGGHDARLGDFAGRARSPFKAGDMFRFSLLLITGTRKGCHCALSSPLFCFADPPCYHEHSSAHATSGHPLRSSFDEDTPPLPAQQHHQHPSAVLPPSPGPGPARRARRAGC